MWWYLEMGLWGRYWVLMMSWGWCPHDGGSVLMRSKELFLSFHPVRTQQEGSHLQGRKRKLTRVWLCWYLTLDSHPPELWQIDFSWLSHPVCCGSPRRLRHPPTFWPCALLFLLHTPSLVLQMSWSSEKNPLILQDSVQMTHSLGSFLNLLEKVKCSCYHVTISSVS